MLVTHNENNQPFGSTLKSKAFKGPFGWSLKGWKSGRIENDRRIEKIYNFSHFCLVGIEKVEKWKK